MEFRLLKTFVTVARLENFSAAARELNTVQPAISKQIFDLEHELGTTLFWRTTREVRLTPAGRVLLREASEILSQEQRARERVSMVAKGKVGRLRIGYLSPACLLFLPDLVRNYVQQYPKVEVTLQDMTVQEQLDGFAEGKLDIGLSRPMPEQKQKKFVVEELYRDSLSAFVPDSYPFADRSDVWLKELAPFPFVLFDRKEAPILFDKIIGVCHEAGFSPNATQQPTSMQTVLTEVAAGLGISVAPACIRFLNATGCSILSIKDEISPLSLELHYLDDPAAPTLSGFVGLVQRAKPAIQSKMNAKAI